MTAQAPRRCGRLFAVPAVPAWLDRTEQRLYALEKWICVIALAVMLGAVALGVAIRYWNLPLPNVGEWAVVAMSPLTFVGAALCTKAHAHISVDVIRQLRNPRVRCLADLAVVLSMLVFAGVYAWLGWALFTDALASGERLLDVGTPLAVPVAFLWAGMLCMMAHCLLDLWRTASTGCRGPGEEEAP